MCTDDRPNLGYPELLTKRQAAELLSVSTRTIDRWLRVGVLPPEAKVHYGGSSRFVTSILLSKANAAAKPRSEEA